MAIRGLMFLALLSVPLGLFGQSCPVELVVGKIAPTGDGGLAINAVLDGSSVPAAIGADGFIYLAQRGSQRIRRIRPDGVIETIAGTGERGSGGDGGPAIAAQLDYPSLLAASPDGSVYFVDAANNRIRRIDAKGLVTRVVGNGVPGFNGESGLGIDFQTNGVQAIAAAPDGSLYYSDSDSSRLCRLRPNGTVETVAGNKKGGDISAIPDGTAATSVGVIPTSALAVDKTGRVFFYDIVSQTLERLDLDGRLYRVAGVGLFGTFSGTAQPVAEGQKALNVDLGRFYPTSLAAASDGRLFMRSLYTGQVYVLMPNGVFGPAVASGVFLPPFALDALDQMILSGSMVRRLDPRTGAITSVAGKDNTVIPADGATALTSTFTSSYGIAAEAGGSFVLTDSAARRVWRVTSGGLLKLIGGNGSPGLAAGTPIASQTPIDRPSAVVSRSDLGVLLFAHNNADTPANNILRRIRPDGTVELVAGLGDGAKSTGLKPLETDLNLTGSFGLDQASRYFLLDGNGGYRVGSLDGSVWKTVQPDLKLSPDSGISSSPDGRLFAAANNKLYSLTVDAATQIGSPRSAFRYGPMAWVSGSTGYSWAGNRLWRIHSDGNVEALPIDGNTYPAEAAGLGSIGSMSASPEGDLLLNNGSRVYRLKNAADCATVARGPRLNEGGVVNGASFTYRDVISPGEIISMFGTGLGPVPAAGLVQGPDGQPASATREYRISSATQFFDFSAMPIFASESQISWIAPTSLKAGDEYALNVSFGPAIATYGGKTLKVVEATPALFTFGATGSGQAAALNQDGSANSASNPLARGQVIQLFGTGFGAFTDNVPYGSIAVAPLPKLKLPVTVTVGGVEAVVEYAGAAPGLLYGVNQLNVRIPQSVSLGNVALVVKVGSTVSDQQVMVAVK